MDDHKKNPDILEVLFKQMPEEELPASFRQDIMQQIALETAKANKRSERFGLMAVIVASLGLLGIAAATLYFYIGLPEKIELPIAFPKQNGILFSFYSHIGILALLLLLLDYKLRKVFLKRE